MKSSLASKIFLYLFLFALIYVIFQYANSKRYVESTDKQITILEHQRDSLTQEVDSLKQIVSTDTPAETTDSYENNNIFSLKTDENAREYFEVQNIDIDSLSAKIESEIIGKNLVDGGNPLVPFHGIAGAMKINRIHIINNRWIAAQFTDGTYWGETIISYFLDKNGELQFDNLDGVIYNK